MRIFYDTEFIEDGRTIDLISIGMVREDGAELYFINDDAGVMRRATAHNWLRENVLPSLPVISKAHPLSWNWNQKHPDYPRVVAAKVIRAAVQSFILAVPDPQLWADWCAYDHVVLCQLWGPMIALPDGVPMWTHEFRQLVEQAGNPDLPSLPDARGHNALDDARELKFRYQRLAPDLED